ncbi:flagellar biosynthetic protein FliR [Andreprevotia lacus DSM 23236]|jgi:flagellar biosynthetic protein FliR|uniref:Flagellar biosynthetic protein FliR n=1 Tax=Andreprevotia lacus DSM 23236 TaxID=1121001 RepID=A0A1W1XUY8_9NEIS|nr:flagellar biosynthetic protein FliR [Andreprevotia lacus]SMC27707.1 flagellar biosynthetic protein FliR [Andreprevotia lacus DSM 23236]
MADMLGLALRYDTARLVATLLCATRLAAAISLTPVLAGVAMPTRLRAMLVLALAFCMAGWQGPLPAQPHDVFGLAGMMLAEVLFGAALAFGVFTAFGAFSLAGHLLDFQIGFNLGALFDPVTRRQSPVLARLFDLFAVVAFFLADLHHMLLRGFAATLEVVPLGTFRPMQLSPTVLVEQLGSMFVYGLKLAAPVMVCLLLVELGMAVLSRNIPQLNVFVISMPLKVLIGLSMLAFSLRYLGPVVAKSLNAMFPFWERVLAA